MIVGAVRVSRAGVHGHFGAKVMTAGVALNGSGRATASMGVVADDLDGDGLTDLFITNFDDDYNVLYRNDGRNSFSDISYAAKVAALSFPYVGWGTKFFDYDSDVLVDLFVANGHVYPQIKNFHQRNFVHRNNRDGTFTEVAEQLGSPFAEKRAARGTAFGDIDNDGDIDIVINNLDGSGQLLRNCFKKCVKANTYDPYGPMRRYLFDLLRANAIGMTLTEYYAMLPAARYGEWKVLDLSFTPQDFSAS